MTTERVLTSSPLCKCRTKRPANVVLRRKRADFIRDRHFGAEFLRLIIGARHQRHAGNSGRKAEIVFNPRRSAGLTTERAAIEHDDGEAFRRSINGGGKAGRSGADDGNVIEAIRIDRPDQADAARQLVFARVAQQLSARTEHDRQLSRDRHESARSGLSPRRRCRDSAIDAGGRCGGENLAAAARRHFRRGRR